MTSAAVALTVLAGLAGSIQVAVMGRFGDRVGVLEALSFSTVIQLVLSMGILLVARAGVGGLGGAIRSPTWMWLGGVMGLTVVFTITFAQPKIGATATIGILIAGQLVMGALIDRFGCSASSRSRSRRARSGSPSWESARHCRSFANGWTCGRRRGPRWSRST